MGIGAGAGTVSGALGVGGGVILVPYLVLVRHVEQKRAQATSLVMVAMAAAAGCVPYARDGSVAWSAAVCILMGGLVGAWLGAHIVQRVHGHWLQIAFGIVLVLAAARLVWPGSSSAEEFTSPPDLQGRLAVAYVISGLGMGLLSAMFGIGGGILLVPILVTLLNFGQHLASGTSLAVMAPTALFGALRLTRPGLTDWRVGSRIGVGGIVGAVIGASVALYLPAEVLRWVFAGLMVVTAFRMIRAGWRLSRSPAAAPSSSASG